MDRNKELEKNMTETKLMGELEKDYQDVLMVFKDDTEMDQFRQKYETFFLQSKVSYENENKWIKKCKEYNQ